MTWVHQLVELDKTTGLATCKECGPVQGKWINHKGRWACPTAHKNQKGVWTKGIGYESRESRDNRQSRQSGKCAICQVETTLHRDHDHQTGKDRAFLCRSCNIGLGNFNDNPELLEAAASYLRWYAVERERFNSDCIVELEVAT